MRIKPVLVPDHTADDLRRLMDHFAEASTGPTKRQLTESRAAVAAAQDVSESSHDVDHMQGATRNDLAKDMQAGCKRCGGHRHVYKDETGKVSQNNFPGAKKYKCGACSKPGVADDGRKQQFRGTGNAGMPRTDDDGNVLEQGVAEAKEKTPGVALSKAYKKDFDGKKPGQGQPETALTGAYSATSKPGGALKKKNVSEGFMDTVKQAFNDCVVGYPQGTSDEQFIQGWARAIQAETGRDIPLEKLTKLYQDYAERSDELMQSHGTTNESEHNHDHDEEEHEEVCPECDGAGCPECYGEEDRDRAYDRARGMERESVGQAVQESLIDDDSTDIRELLNFNLFRDYDSFKDGDIDPASYSPEEIQAWEQLFAAWGPIAVQLERQINKAAASGAVLTPEQNQEINDNWYDGSDAYDDPLRELPGIYGREIPIIRKILRQSIKALQGVAEAGRPDVMRHKGDTTVKVVKRGGKPIGEIGIDAEASPGNGQYYVKLYDGSYDAVGFDTAAEALAELKAAISEGITETADGVKYGVFAKGGSVGSQRFRDDPLKTFDTKEEATADARRRRSGLSKGERGYYRMGYVVRPIKGVEEGLGKSIKRAAQGWGSPQDKPADIVKRNKGYDTDTAKKVRAGIDGAADHSPQGLQKRVLDRKLKDVAEGYDAGGAYDKWDPKHPDFVKNFRKFQASNPGATLKDFIAHLKKGVTEGLDASEDAVRVRGGQRFVFPEDGKFGYATDGGSNEFTILDQETGEVRDIPLDKLPDNPFQADLENLVNDYDEEQFRSGASVPDWIKKSSGMWKEGEDVAESIDPIEQLRADIRRFAQ